MIAIQNSRSVGQNITDWVTRFYEIDTSFANVLPLIKTPLSNLPTNYRWSTYFNANESTNVIKTNTFC